MKSFDVVTLANVYLNDNSQLGRATEVSGLVLKPVKKDHNPIGLYGKKKVPVGLESIEITIKWDFIHEKVTISDRFDFTIKGNVRRTENGVTRNFPAVIEVSGTLDENDIMGTLKHQDWSGQSMKLTLDYVRVQHDGVEILEIDVDENVYRENGEDKLEEMLANI